MAAYSMTTARSSRRTVSSAARSAGQERPAFKRSHSGKRHFGHVAQTSCQREILSQGEKRIPLHTSGCASDSDARKTQCPSCPTPRARANPRPHTNRWPMPLARLRIPWPSPAGVWNHPGSRFHRRSQIAARIAEMIDAGNIEDHCVAEIVAAFRQHNRH